MSSAPSGYDPEETLSGNWTDVSLVTDVGTAEETETFLTRVAGDITVTKNNNEWESQPNASRHMQSGETHVSYEVEVPLDHDADSDLETASVIDETDANEVFNHTWDALRLYVFQEREDADGEQVLEREFERVRASLGDEEFSQDDTASATLTFTVMGERKNEFTTV